MKHIADATAEIDTLLGQARGLLQDGRFADAIAACQAAIALDPDHGDALYTLAVAQRYQRQFADALATTDRLISLDDRNGRAFQERGHCLRDMGDADGAFAAYQAAVAHNNALPASWAMLADFHHAAGQVRLAARRLSGLSKVAE